MPEEPGTGIVAELVRAPHSPLKGYYGDEDDRPTFLRTLFDRTAPDYDRLEHLMSLGCGSWYRRDALRRAGLRPGMRLLDVGVGTGLTALQAVLLTGDPRSVVGIDPSVGMMASAKLPEGVQLIEGRAEALPVPDAGFDFLSMGYALRHIADFTTACHEFLRVLKPGGRLCLLEITCPESQFGQGALKIYLRGLIPLVATAIGRHRESARLWRYYWDTIESCVPPARIVATLRAAGFVGVYPRSTGIFTEYVATKPA